MKTKTKQENQKKMSNISLYIDFAYDEWKNSIVNIEDLSNDILSKTIEYVQKNNLVPFLHNSKDIVVSLLLADNETIRKLNKEYRGFDKATNVLSFANCDDEDFHRDIEVFDEIELGGIAIAHETLAKEACDANISFLDHYTHLFIHGTLHLLGFDHEKDEEAEIMEGHEICLLKEFNINNPYME